MDRSPAVEARIRDEVAELDRYGGRITSCHVVVEMPHHNHQHGDQFRINIEIQVPGSRIVVAHHPSLHSTLVQGGAAESEKHLEAQPDHKDIYVCIRDAFLAARRRVEDYARIQRGETKHHAETVEAM